METDRRRLGAIEADRIFVSNPVAEGGLKALKRGENSKNPKENEMGGEGRNRPINGLFPGSISSVFLGICGYGHLSVRTHLNRFGNTSGSRKAGRMGRLSDVRVVISAPMKTTVAEEVKRGGGRCEIRTLRRPRPIAVFTLPSVAILSSMLPIFARALLMIEGKSGTPDHWEH